MNPSDDKKNAEANRRYEEYERRAAEIRQENEVLLEEFEAWLSEKNISRKTIENHFFNVEFYISRYLLYNEECYRAVEGVSMMDGFFNYWFPHKAMWASPSSVKSTAASIMKFYTFLTERKLIGNDEMKGLKEEIKEALPRWMKTAAY